MEHEMQEISGFGLKVHIMASSTFPVGFPVTQFADDADPFDAPAIAYADKAMGLNGDLITWSKATPIDITINVIPDSADDLNLQILAEANRVSKGKTSARDVITLTRIDAAGRIAVLSNGRLTNAPPLSSVASAGRKKTAAYTFTFESKAGL
jgi:hypothetical protein